MVTLLNTSAEDFPIAVGDRIAQLVFQKVEHATFIAVGELPESTRGDTGFGSSGKN
jgi:dUTP pyrophosphatase